MRTMFMFVLLLTCVVMKAQINGEALPPEGKVNEFSEWVAATATLGDNSEVQFEYRIKLVKKTGMACHYEIEVKNNSDRKLNFGIAFTYYDQLVKRDMKEAVKGKIKPGATGKLKMIAQGCKKKKDAEKSDDYSVCTACGMTYQIVVTE